MARQQPPNLDAEKLHFVKGEAWNNLVNDVARVMTSWMGGTTEYYDSASGRFPRTNTRGIRPLRLDASLQRTGNATAKQLVWDATSQSWAADGAANQTVYGDFTRGYHFSGDDVMCMPLAQRLYAVTPGHFFVRGTLDGQLTSGGNATLSVTTQNGSGDWQDSAINVTVSEDIGIDNPAESAAVLVATWHEQAQIWIATGAPCSATDGSS